MSMSDPVVAVGRLAAGLTLTVTLAYAVPVDFMLFVNAWVMAGCVSTDVMTAALPVSVTPSVTVPDARFAVAMVLMVPLHPDADEPMAA